MINYTCRVMMDLVDVILEPPAVMALDIVGMVLMKLTVSRHNSTPTCIYYTMSRLCTLYMNSSESVVVYF